MRLVSGRRSTRASSLAGGGMTEGIDILKAPLSLIEARDMKHEQGERRKSNRHRALDYPASLEPASQSFSQSVNSSSRSFRV